MNRAALLASAAAVGFLASVLFRYLDFLRGDLIGDLVDRRAEQATLAYAVVAGTLVMLSFARLISLAGSWGFLASSATAGAVFLAAAVAGLPLNPATVLVLVTSSGLASAVYWAYRARRM